MEWMMLSCAGAEMGIKYQNISGHQQLQWDLKAT